MNKTLPCRLATVLSLAMMAIASITPARAASFPALNDPKSGETHAGKFVWAELFTSDAAAATKFYTGVFSWTAATVVEHGDAYTVFSNDGHPVAGLRQRTVAKPGHPARWIHYVSVTDIDAALSVVAKAGGERPPASSPTWVRSPSQPTTRARPSASSSRVQATQLTTSRRTADGTGAISLSRTRRPPRNSTARSSPTRSRRIPAPEAGASCSCRRAA